jgi:pilus assembly protein Flp/PilA
MSKFQNLIQKLRRDEDGAALIEYTVLLGILLVAVIVSIGTVGTWVSARWTSLAASL